MKRFIQRSLSVMVLAALAACAKSPQDEIGAAEKALRTARDLGARECAPEQFKSAEEMMAKTYKLDSEKEFDRAKEAAITTEQLARVAKGETEARVAKGCKAGAASAATGATDALAGGDGARIGGAGLSQSDVAKEVQATKTGEGSLGEGTLVKGLKPVHFGYDEATLSTEELDLVSKNAEWLKDRPTVKIQVEGHTDERGTAEYNLALGERRAKTVKEALKRFGVEEARITTISYGEETPADPGHTEEAWKQNRRAEFVVK